MTNKKSSPSLIVIACSKCGAKYALGYNAVAVTLQDVLSAGRRTLVMASTPNPLPEIPPYVGTSHSVTAFSPEVEKCKAAVLRAGVWCCENCGLEHVNRLNKFDNVARRVEALIFDSGGIIVSLDQITPDAKFIEDLGMDKFDLTELFLKLEEEFGVKFIPTDDCESVGGVIRYFEEKTKTDA